jgi:putative transposase
MATDNPSWGYTRIRGALLNVGHDLSCSTIARILRDRGISPSPERLQRTTWRQFLRSHADAIAATDFFTVEVMTAVGIVRYFVLFVIEQGTRRVDVFGITRDPCEAWMRIVARGATDVVDGCLRNMRYLLHDRDPLFCRSFRERLAGSGVKCVRLPARSPNLNAYAERFVGSIRRECLDRVIPLSEQHLRLIVGQYVRHYNTERNHQGIGNRLIEPTIAANGGGTIQCRERLGGLLRFYHREAA